MSGDDWVPLRQWIEEAIAAQVDRTILEDADRDLRAWLAAHRIAVIRRCADQVELVQLRRIATERAQPDLRVVGTTRHAQRTVKVGPR
jgi:hypothetical protein